MLAPGSRACPDTRLTQHKLITRTANAPTRSAPSLALTALDRWQNLKSLLDLNLRMRNSSVRSIMACFAAHAGQVRVTGIPTGHVVATKSGRVLPTNCSGLVGAHVSDLANW